jgi:hypothetical protein
MSNCQPINCNQDVPVPIPVPLPPCPDGESCNEVVDAHCVVYTNEPLPPVNVQTNDRLNDIIRKWSQGVLAGTQAVSTGVTPTTTIEGNGTSLQPLKVDVQVSSRPENLLTIVNEVDQQGIQRTGLEVVLTDAVVASILTRILQSDTLSLQFCELIRPCLDNSCGIATGLQVQPI